MIALFATLLAGDLTDGGNPSRHVPVYEALLDCYVGFMNSKGVTLASNRGDVMRWDGAARKRCDAPYSALVRQVGTARAQRAWRGLWSENSARD